MRSVVEIIESMEKDLETDEKLTLSVTEQARLLDEIRRLRALVQKMNEKKS